MNHFARLRALGYTRLVPIIPPDAPISPRSSLFKRVGTHQDGRGKTPGVKGSNGDWYGFDWVPYESDEKDDARWHAMGAGVGIKLGDGLVAFDADTMDERCAALVRNTILDVLDAHGSLDTEAGDILPTRIGRAPKALYLLRVSEDVPYQRIEFGERNERGVPERVELLTAGKQFVAEGTHPKTGQPYRWTGDMLWFADLPIVTPTQIAEIFNRLHVYLPAASPLITEGAGEETSQAALRGDEAKIRAAVAAIPNTSDLFPSRESYRDMGYAIKAAVSHEPTAYAIWAEWCERWTDGANEPDVMESDWRRMKPPYRRGASWIYGLAEEHSHGAFKSADVWFDEVTIEEEARAEASLESEKSREQNDVFPLLTIGEIMDMPPQRWLVARHVPAVSLGFLYSEPGVGKTFLALDMALSIASGHSDWFGDAIDRGGVDDAAVLYIASEGAWGFRNRIKAWMNTRGASESLAKNFLTAALTIDFMSDDDVAKLLRTLAALGAGRRPCLVVVDTVSRALPGADENLQKDMTRFVAACDRIRDRFRCAVLGVHHAGKSGDMRGSTVLRGAGDYVLRLVRKEKASVGLLECEKQKDGPDGWEDAYSFDVVGLGGSETSRTVRRVLSGMEGAAGDSGGMTPDKKAAVLGDMAAAWDRGEPWSPHARAGDRCAIRHMCARHGFKADDAKEWLDAMSKLGLISVEMQSTKSKMKGYKVIDGTLAKAPGQSVFD